MQTFNDPQLRERPGFVAQACSACNSPTLLVATKQIRWARVRKSYACCTCFHIDEVVTNLDE